VENQVSIARDLRRLEQERDGVCPIDFAVVNAEEKVDREIRNNVLWDVILLRTPSTQSVPLFARQAKSLFHWPRQTPAHGGTKYGASGIKTGLENTLSTLYIGVCT